MGRIEHLLLVNAACFDDSKRDAFLSGIPGQDIDWEYVLRCADLHRMTNLFYRHLTDNLHAFIPNHILCRLREHFRNSAIRNALQTAELFSILDLFKGNGINAIPFKGPVLSLALYSDPAIREFSDLDILVQEHDVFKALRLLRILEYEQIPNYSPAVEHQITKREYHYHIRKPSGSSLVEIHWNIAPHYLDLPISMDVWWEHATTIKMDYRYVFSLSPEDLLIALSVHGARHRWASLCWIADVARLLAIYPRLDWDYVLHKYWHPEIKRILFLSLNLSQKILAAHVPEEVRFQIGTDPTVILLTDQIYRRIFTADIQPTGSCSVIFDLKLKTTLTRRLSYCFRIMTTPTILEWKKKLPCLFFPIYFVLRPLRLLSKYLLGKRD